MKTAMVLAGAMLLSPAMAWVPAPRQARKAG